MPDALKKADEVLQQAVQGITDLINLPALINLDFADVSTVMKDKGMAHIGIGSAKGDDKAIEAVKLAVASPLLETTINGASHVIINISGDISLMDANDAASYVQELAGDDANIIFGAKYDETMVDEATITVIATGLDAGTRTSMPSMSSMMKYDQAPVRPTVTPNMASRTAMGNGLHTAAPTARPVAPVQPAAPTATPAQPAAPTMGIQRPVQPQSNVQPVEINIPDFLKNSKR